MTAAEYNAICARCMRRYYTVTRPLDGWVDIERCAKCLKDNPRYTHQGQVITSSEPTQYKGLEIKRRAPKLVAVPPWESSER